MGDVDVAVERLQGQLDEIDALIAMFPEPGAVEFSKVERENLEAARRLCLQYSGISQVASVPTTPELSGMLSLLGCIIAGDPLRLRFQFPATYPDQPLKAQVLTNAARPEWERLQQEVVGVCGDHRGGPCLLLAVDALQRAGEAGGGGRGEGGAAAAGGGSGHADGALQETQQTQCVVVRKLVWFHHIKNLGKRKNLVEWARQLELGGHSKPGFPGIVVVEGGEEEVEEYVQRVRGLRWQAMSVRAEEREGGIRAAGAVRRKFGGRFSEVPGEDMSALAALCREAGAEQLFLAGMKLGGGESSGSGGRQG